jgi:prepilin-type N-terminal cleavage/methylation domain-containing protein
MKTFKKGFTILELLVVLAVVGVFTAIAYPNISIWIDNRNIKNEISELVSFIKEIKSEVSNGKYGMVQLQLSGSVEVYTMSPEKFLETYKNIGSSSSSYKINKSCGKGSSQPHLVKNNAKEKIFFGRASKDSVVWVYPYNSTEATVICITKDNTIKYSGSNITLLDPSTGKNHDAFIFCPKNSSTQNTCRPNASLDIMYQITINSFQEIKVWRKAKGKNWVKIDG